MREALQCLDDAGHIAYVVGGSVRDYLLKREPKDYDIATSASPDEICQLFPHAITVGKAFGVIKLPLNNLEIATFREDLDYRDHRHPRSVRFAGPIEDAKRRDFTINALFYDPKTSRILDCVGGMDDLSKTKVIRAIGDPMERFREDSLRLLRAVRFSVRFDLGIESGTGAAIRAHAHLVQHVSGERVREELAFMWSGPRPALALQNLSQLGLLEFVIPELEALRRMKHSEAWKHTLKVLDVLERFTPVRSAALNWGAVLLNLGKPWASERSANKNWIGHEAEGARLARQVCERLKMSRHDIERVVTWVEEQQKFREVFQMRESTLQRFLRKEGFDEQLALHRADAIATDGNLASYEFCSSRLEELRSLSKGADFRLLDGKDLIQLGLQPGPEFSRILRVVDDLALERTLTTKEEALEYVVKHFVR